MTQIFDVRSNLAIIFGNSLYKAFFSPLGMEKKTAHKPYRRSYHLLS